MLVAIMSDIHGNLEALEAVLADMGLWPVEEVVSIGDMIGYGPNPEEVLIALRQREVLCCMGNHELGIVSEAQRHLFNATALKSLSLTASLLSAESLAYIETLPHFLCLAGARFVHGFPPQSVTTYLFQAKETRLASWFAQGEKLTFIGHTHELALVHWNAAKVERRELTQERLTLEEGSCIVNTGSVGQPRDGNNNAKYLLWDTEHGFVEVRFVPYDIESTVAKIRERGFPDYNATRLW